MIVGWNSSKKPDSIQLIQAIAQQLWGDVQPIVSFDQGNWRVEFANDLGPITSDDADVIKNFDVHGEFISTDPKAALAQVITNAPVTKHYNLDLWLTNIPNAGFDSKTALLNTNLDDDKSLSSIELKQYEAMKSFWQVFDDLDVEVVRTNSIGKFNYVRHLPDDVRVIIPVSLLGFGIKSN